MTTDTTTQPGTALPTTPKNKEPYQQAYYPPVPTGFTRFMRGNLIWQFWRFIAINIKMFKLMLSSHH
ncbi:hypothetical protein U5801_09140 [Lamprobacter modestohalophilus]|uniref:Uncharacterized protein n=1 Tax=Lamprobacter modestohalophilus TaxID=1064514 RepID=A0A9X1B4Y7_9GAMM|nr:hypothetical protein [Lamprobacter modestohalophilus]MCF7978081.1 hypothetical protein [Chromatiaceae bacterium]MBK1619127.1 hypothetical protein [Lamprobacter modestohalophilus]MCF7996286.1 hypothetical protein [Chromatiaceae bacterium]MCF8014945.1 hypothetical protein [Chromatiaceae bacterium]MEA1049973.1 hypothetical protein [Lamprobacter modestohalophilus]